MFNQHPKGLYKCTIFFLPKWKESTSKSPIFLRPIMRGILVLFMTASILEGGLQIDNVSASAIYGIYSACVYLVALLGGWLADRHIGQQKAILYGGMVIMLGHFF